MKEKQQLTAIVVIVLLTGAMLVATVLYFAQPHVDYRIGVLFMPCGILINFVVLQAMKRRWK